MQIVRVALDVPLHRFFDYLAPAGDVLTAADIGLRVRVPFGRQANIGVVVDLPEHSDFAPEQLKSVEAVLRDLPPLPAETRPRDKRLRYMAQAERAVASFQHWLEETAL